MSKYFIRISVHNSTSSFLQVGKEKLCRLSINNVKHQVTKLNVTGTGISGRGIRQLIMVEVQDMRKAKKRAIAFSKSHSMSMTNAVGS